MSSKKTYTWDAKRQKIVGPQGATPLKIANLSTACYAVLRVIFLQLLLSFGSREKVIQIIMDSFACSAGDAEKIFNTAYPSSPPDDPEVRDPFEEDLPGSDRPEP